MRRRKWKRYFFVGLLLFVALAGWKLFKGGTQEFSDDLERFKYGSLGAEPLAGIPYPIFIALPQIFPDLINRYATQGWGKQKTGQGGYGAFGLAWEKDQQLPVGFSIKRLSFDRVTVNCALCHTTVYRLNPVEAPHFAYGGPGHSVDFQGLLRFLFAAGNDKRFNAGTLLPAITQNSKLGWIDQAFYAAVLIPATRFALHIAEGQLDWMQQKTAWGPGRDDAFNLPKFILTQSPWDDTVGNTDFPALWQLGERDGHLIHSGGEAKSVSAVIASSALGTGSLPFGEFEARNRWLERFLSNLAPPAFPGPRDAALELRGAELFNDHCADCHARNGARTGNAITLAEIGTDPEHVLAWQEKDATRMNRLTARLGLRNAELQGAQGYVAKPLVGVWLLAPYLHNGSVPTLYDLLSSPAQRPTVFFRGYDVIDMDNVGFIASGPAAEACGFKFDTRLRGNGNGGHSYGVTLDADNKQALIAYLKTL